jgi:hypothetical protein
MGPDGERTPAAFLARRANGPAPAASFIGLDDEQVLKIATAAFTAAQAEQVGSTARARQWARFDGAMGELAGRGMRHVLAKLRERDEAAGRDEGEAGRSTDVP